MRIDLTMSFTGTDASSSCRARNSPYSSSSSSAGGVACGSALFTVAAMPKAPRATARMRQRRPRAAKYADTLSSSVVRDQPYVSSHVLLSAWGRMRGDRDPPPSWRRDQRDLNFPATEFFETERFARSGYSHRGLSSGKPHAAALLLAGGDVAGCRWVGVIASIAVPVRVCTSPAGRPCRHGDAIARRRPIPPPAPCGRRDCRNRRA